MNGAPCSSEGTPSPMDSPTTEEKNGKKSLTRSASMSSLDFIQIQEECTALLKTKSHSFKALPALFLLDNDVKYESSIGPNVIMVRTLPPMKMSLTETIVAPVSSFLYTIQFLNLLKQSIKCTMQVSCKHKKS